MPVPARRRRGVPGLSIGAAAAGAAALFCLGLCRRVAKALRRSRQTGPPDPADAEEARLHAPFAAAVVAGKAEGSEQVAGTLGRQGGDLVRGPN